MQTVQEKNINALLIEDDPEDTLLLMELLSQSSWPSFRFTLVCADNLKNGLERLSDGQIEVVLLDLILPDSQGLETVLKVRARAPEVPIVVLTGLRDEAMGLDAVMHGAQDYLVKGGIDGHMLKRTVAYAVERHRMLASLKGIVDGSADGMVVVDARGTVSYINPAAQILFGRDGNEMLGKTFPFALPPEGSAEIRLKSDDGVDHIAQMRVTGVDWKDQPAHLASIRDITDLRRVEQLKAEVQERRRTDQLKDNLIGTISHEMRTPLTVIKAGVDYLREGLAGSLTSRQTTLVNMMHGSLQRVLKVINNLLDLSRLESGRAKMHPQRIDAGPLIRQEIENFRMLAGEKGPSIQENLPKHLPAAYADSDLFVQVLDNLLSNAMRYAKTKVEVRASVHQGGAERKYLQFSVADDGAGIPKSHIGDLFNKFVQVDRIKGRSDYKGTGLGLAICKEILERQQGKIWAESTEGQGTIFNFILPRYEPEMLQEQGGAYARLQGKA